VTGFVVAIDGPAGSGKSSVSKAVATRLGFGYLDTGAGYRAFAVHGLNNPGVLPENLTESFDYRISINPAAQNVFLNGQDVTDLIRTDDIAKAVGPIAQNLAIRQFQNSDARARILSCELPGIVVEGRDITTVVAPDAAIRILLTASEEVRMKRRGLEQTESADNLAQRDISDSKVVDFMTPSLGVELVDTTNLDFEGSVQKVLEVIEAKKHG
jgi:cytidylate kinase